MEWPSSTREEVGGQAKAPFTAQLHHQLSKRNKPDSVDNDSRSFGGGYGCRCCCNTTHWQTNQVRVRHGLPDWLTGIDVLVGPPGWHHAVRL